MRSFRLSTVLTVQILVTLMLTHVCHKFLSTATTTAIVARGFVIIVFESTSPIFGSL